MRAASESYIRLWPRDHVQLVRFVEYCRITVLGAEKKHQAVARPYRLTANHASFLAYPHRALNIALKSKDLGYDGRRQRKILAQTLAQARLMSQRADQQADQPDRRLGADSIVNNEVAAALASFALSGPEAPS